MKIKMGDNRDTKKCNNNCKKHNDGKHQNENSNEKIKKYDQKKNFNNNKSKDDAANYHPNERKEEGAKERIKGVSPGKDEEKIETH